LVSHIQHIFFIILKVALFESSFGIQCSLSKSVLNYPNSKFYSYLNLLYFKSGALFYKLCG
jgi:hypothetical protein